MKVIVLGASGFIGQHVVAELVTRSHQVIAVSRNPPSTSVGGTEDGSVRWVQCDLYANPPVSPRSQFGDADVVIDLAWPGLPNYKELFHVETNLPSSFRMLKAFVADGFREIVVAGTCYEYGMRSGPLTVETPTQPVVSYGVAKDGLRRWLQLLQYTIPFHLRWCRIFYVYGPGQSQKSLLPQLEAAIENGDPTFPMSGGEQLRDFIPVTVVAEQMSEITQTLGTSGIFHVCSGQPISVRRFVEEAMLRLQKTIDLQLGHYPYPDFEPMAFWGVHHANPVQSEESEA